MYNKYIQFTGVYKITNICNNKFYIGSTSISFKERWRNHVKSFKKHSNSRYLQNAWDKYGKDNFKFEILIICSPEDCLKYEQYLLDYLKPWNSNIGYNIAKVAGSARGIVFTELARINCSKRQMGAKNHFFGKKHSEETKKLMSLVSSVKRPVEGICKKTGLCIELQKISDAKQYGFNNFSNISTSIRLGSTYKGYYWQDLQGDIL